jgi:hypothetical protein
MTKARLQMLDKERKLHLWLALCCASEEEASSKEKCSSYLIEMYFLLFYTRRKGRWTQTGQLGNLNTAGLKDYHVHILGFCVIIHEVSPSIDGRNLVQPANSNANLYQPKIPHFYVAEFSLSS